jgi:hypothetical protein
MAGGMSKRGNWGPMADRVAGSPAAEQPPEPPAVKHCWVNGRHGRVPGLLLEWRNVAGVWSGRVVRPVHDGTGWVLVEEWIEAALLDPCG